MTTMISLHPMAECIGVAIDGKVIVYHDANRDGRVVPSEFYTMGPPDQPFRFKDVIAQWNGKAFVTSGGATTGASGGYTQADMDAAEKQGWNAALDKVDAATKGLRR